MTSSRSSLSALPPDIVRYISQIRDLSTKDIIQLCKTERRLNDLICNNDIVWNYLFRERLSRRQPLPDRETIKGRLHALDEHLEREDHERANEIVTFGAATGSEIPLLNYLNQADAQSRGFALNLLSSAGDNKIIPIVVESLRNEPEDIQRYHLGDSISAAAAKNNVETMKLLLGYYPEAIEHDLSLDIIRDAISRDSVEAFDYLLTNYEPIITARVTEDFEMTPEGWFLTVASRTGARRIFERYFQAVPPDFPVGDLLENAAGSHTSEILWMILNRFGEQISPFGYREALRVAVESDSVNNAEILLRRVPPEGQREARIMVQSPEVLRLFQQIQPYTFREAIQVLAHNLRDEDMFRLLVSPDFSGSPQNEKEETIVAYDFLEAINQRNVTVSDVEHFFNWVPEMALRRAVVGILDPVFDAEIFDAIEPYLSGQARLGLLLTSLSDNIGDMPDLLNKLLPESFNFGRRQMLAPIGSSLKQAILLPYLETDIRRSFALREMERNKMLPEIVVATLGQEERDKLFLEAAEMNLFNRDLFYLATEEAINTALESATVSEAMKEKIRQKQAQQRGN